MLDRLGLDRRDGRNLLVVVGIVAVVVALTLTGETVFVRAVTGLVAGIISAIAFVVVTVVINAYKPNYWR